MSTKTIQILVSKILMISIPLDMIQILTLVYMEDYMTGYLPFLVQMATLVLRK